MSIIGFLRRAGLGAALLAPEAASKNSWAADGNGNKQHSRLMAPESGKARCGMELAEVATKIVIVAHDYPGKDCCCE